MKWWLGVFLFFIGAFPLFAREYQTFEKNGKVGLKDEEGKIVLQPTFEALGWSDGNFSVIGEITGYRQQGLWGIVNLNGEFISKPEYESLVYSGGDCLIVKKKINAVSVKSGCINLRGEIKIPFVYDGVRIHGLRAIVFNLTNARYQYGLTDINHRILIPPQYKYIRPLGTLRYALENTKNKIALFTEEGKSLTNFSIDSVSEFFRNYAILYQDQLQGLIDRDGLVKLEIKYSQIKISEEGKILAKLPAEWRLINSKNEITEQVFADEVKPQQENFIIRKGETMGLADKNFKRIIEIQYQNLSALENGKYLVKLKNKMGVVDEADKPCIPFLFDSLVFEKGNYKGFIKGAGWQLLDENGRTLTGKYYDELGSKNVIGFTARSKGFYGIVNQQGHEQIHCVFDSLSQPVNDLIVVKFKGQYGIVDANEDWRVAPQPFPLELINNDVYLENQRENYFVKTFASNVLYFTPYKLKFNDNDFTEFLPDGTEKTINYNGQIIQRLQAPESVSETFAEREGFRGIKKDGRFGFIDRQGKLRVANRYDSISEFHEALASVKLIGKWGFVNKDDQIVINPNYDSSSYFSNGIAVVCRNKKFGLIGKEGQIFLPMRYDNIERLANQKFRIISLGKIGLADAHGIVQIEPRFNSLQEVGNGMVLVSQDGKFGLITELGINVIPMIYDYLIYSEHNKIFLARKNSTWKEIEIK